MQEKSPLKFLSWCRYLYWSDILYQRFIAHDESEGEIDPSDAEWLTFALSSQWLASLYVVIEGWRNVALHDHVIDELLEIYPDYVKLLRRFRNGVYHFQTEIFDDRLRAFPSQGTETISWAFALLYEFKRFVWQYPDKKVGTDNEKAELRIALGKIIGWLPTDILHTKTQELQELQREAIEMLRGTNDFSSPEARALLAAAENISKITSAIDHSPLLGMLSRLGKRSQKH